MAANEPLESLASPKFGCSNLAAVAVSVAVASLEQVVRKREAAEPPETIVASQRLGHLLAGDFAAAPGLAEAAFAGPQSCCLVAAVGWQFLLAGAC